MAEETKFRDRYQEVLQELVEAKMEGPPIKPREVPAPAPVIDLMAALKHSLTEGQRVRKAPSLLSAPKPHPIGARGRCFFLYRAVEKDGPKSMTEPATVATRRRKKA